MLNPNRSPVPLPHEQAIISTLFGAELSLTIPDAPPTESATGGGSGGAKVLKGTGGVWLTDQRLIFTTPAGTRSTFDSLSVPLHSILSTKFEQPTFGVNFLTFEIKPSPEGGLTDGTKAELRFRDRAMFEFVSILEKTREKAIYMKRQAVVEDEEGLPSYTSPAETVSTSIVAGVPVENPPGYDV